MRIAVFYVSTLIACVAIDFIWFGVAIKRLYRPVLGSLLLDKPRLPAAIAFYLIYIAGITIFVGSPALASGSWSSAAIFGALFGFFCYGTYDLTNQATLRNWDIRITVCDMAWGAALTASSAVIGYFPARAFSPG